MVTCVVIIWKIDVRVGIYPYQCYIVVVLFGKICERNDAYRAFSAEGKNFIGVIFFENFECRFCLF